MKSCSHPNSVCLNEYELIRKYRCDLCDEVMMCSCDREFGEHFLPHQLRQASELRTQRRIEVTIGFQEKICNECRGLPVEAHPVSSIPGRTSKIKRYYWREIYFETEKRFEEWVSAQKASEDTDATQAYRKKIEKQTGLSSTLTRLSISRGVKPFATKPSSCERRFLYKFK